MERVKTFGSDNKLKITIFLKLILLLFILPKKLALLIKNGKDKRYATFYSFSLSFQAAISIRF